MHLQTIDFVIIIGFLVIMVGLGLAFSKRAGGMGFISGRKAFQKPLKAGIEILNAIQDVYLSKEVTIA